jgi:hypothetical protein
VTIETRLGQWLIFLFADYIQNQLKHHRLRSFQEEYVGFLKKHGIGFEERYLGD